MASKKFVLQVSVWLIIGFIIYGFIGVRGREFLEISIPPFWSFLFYGIGGAWFLGGIAAGILLFADYIKFRSIGFKITCILLCPVTIMAIMLSGMFLGMAYYVYYLKQMRGGGHSKALLRDRAVIRVYTITIGITSGFLLFSIMAAFNEPDRAFLYAILYGVCGGWMIGGVISGIMLFIDYMRGKKRGFKVLCVILFPVTYICVFGISIVFGIPHYIYTLVKRKNIKE